MAGDFNKPALSDNYTTFASSVRDLFGDLAKGLDPALSLGTANVPTDAIRWKSSSGYWEKYNGSSWAALTSTYNINVTSADAWSAGRTISLTGDITGTSGAWTGSGNLSFAVTLPNVNSNVGTFGSTSAVPVITTNAKGQITAVSTASLASMAIQAASSVAITGGTITGTAIKLVGGGGSSSELGRITFGSSELSVGDGAGGTYVFAPLNPSANRTMVNHTFSTGCVWNGDPVANATYVSATAPSSPTAGQFWGDTTSMWLKQRSYDNTSWVFRAPLGHGASTMYGVPIVLANAFSNNVTLDTMSGPITGFGSADRDRSFKVVHSATATLVHHATDFILPGGANISVEVGDSYEAVSLGSSKWRIISYQRASGFPLVTTGLLKTSDIGSSVQAYSANANRIVQVVEATPVTSVITCGTIPYDDTIPQNTEGTEIITVTITPTNASNRLRIECDVPVIGFNTDAFALALFQDSIADALAVSVTGYGIGQSRLTFECSAGSTSARTYKVRGGDSAYTAYINSAAGSSARRYGGIAAVTMRVTEIRA